MSSEPVVSGAAVVVAQASGGHGLWLGGVGFTVGLLMSLALAPAPAASASEGSAAPVAPASSAEPVAAAVAVAPAPWVGRSGGAAVASADGGQQTLSWEPGAGGIACRRLERDPEQRRLKGRWRASEAGARLIVVGKDAQGARIREPLDRLSFAGAWRGLDLTLPAELGAEPVELCVRSSDRGGTLDLDGLTLE